MPRLPTAAPKGARPDAKASVLSVVALRARSALPATLHVVRGGHHLAGLVERHQRHVEHKIIVARIFHVLAVVLADEGAAGAVNRAHVGLGTRAIEPVSAREVRNAPLQRRHHAHPQGLGPDRMRAYCAARRAAEGHDLVALRERMPALLGFQGPNGLEEILRHFPFLQEPRLREVPVMLMLCQLAEAQDRIARGAEVERMHASRVEEETLRVLLEGPPAGTGLGRRLAPWLRELAAQRH